MAMFHKYLATLRTAVRVAPTKELHIALYCERSRKSSRRRRILGINEVTMFAIRRRPCVCVCVCVCGQMNLVNINAALKYPTSGSPGVDAPA